MARKPGFGTAVLIGGIGTLAGVVGLAFLLPGGQSANPNSDPSTKLLLAPVTIPAVWIVESVLLGLAFVLCSRLGNARVAWLTRVLAIVAIVGATTWAHWILVSDQDTIR